MRAEGVLAHVLLGLLECPLEVVEVVSELLQEAFIVVLIKQVRHHLEVNEVSILSALVNSGPVGKVHLCS